MWKLTSKKRNEPTVTGRKVSRRIIRIWDPAEAAYDYQIERSVELEWSDGSRTYQSLWGAASPQGPTKPVWQHEASGSKAWADKNAKHYGLKIEDVA